MCCLVPLRAQITTLSLDLKNTYSTYRTALQSDANTVSSYGQFYVLTLGGFLVDERLAQFSAQTSLTDLTSTSFSGSSRQSNHARNVGYYNASLTVFPALGFPLSLYASRTDLNSASSSSTSALEAFSSSGTTAVDVKGLRWSVPKNTYYPQIELNLERTSAIGGTEFYRLDQRNDIAGLRLSNATQDGSSQYSFQYLWRDTKDGAYGFRHQEQEIQFYGNSRMDDNASMFTSAVYAQRGYVASRTLEVGASVAQLGGAEHQVRFTNSENRMPSANGSRDLGNTLTHQSHVVFSDRLQGTFGTIFSLQSWEAGVRRFTSDRGQVQAQIAFDQPLKGAALNANVFSAVGLERYPNAPRRFVQSSRIGVGAFVTRWAHYQINAQNDLQYLTHYDFGNQVQNVLRFSTTTDVVSGVVAGVDLTRQDSRFLDLRLPDFGSTSIGASLTTNLSRYGSVTAQHAVTWSQGYYTDRGARTTASATLVNLVRFLTLQARFERTTSSFTRIRVLVFESDLTYRFYAFAVAGRYSVRAYGRFATHGMQLEVQRPVNFDFRHE